MSNKKSMIAVLLVVVMGMALAACGGALPAQPGSAAAQQTNSNVGGITVIGQGTAYGQPDQATVIVGVESFAPTVQEATTQNQTTLDNVMAALEAAGIAAEDIQTTNYSLYAEQIYGEKGPEGIAGYRISNQVNVKIRDVAVVGDVLGAVTEAGANAIYGINFAVADARKRAESLAELGGVALGDVVIISEVIGTPVMPLGMGGSAMAMEQAASAPGISPGQLSYQVQVQVTYGIQ